MNLVKWLEWCVAYFQPYLSICKIKPKIIESASLDANQYFLKIISYKLNCQDIIQKSTYSLVYFLYFIPRKDF